MNGKHAENRTVNVPKQTGFTPVSTIAVLFLTALALTACGGLAGDPVIVSTLVPVTPTADYPTSLPDLALGAELYQQHCTRCHGIGGAGDGELIGSGPEQIPTPPKSFLDAQTSAEQTPLMWFDTITNGRVEKLMPPWNDALTNTERWAVALYTYTLHYTQADIEDGQALAADQGIKPADLPAANEVAKLTDGDLIARLGLSETALNGLSAAQRTDLAAYARTLTVANPDQMGVTSPPPVATPEPDATAEATAAIGTGTVTGIVTNGTSGAVLDGDLKASLYIITAQGPLAPVEVAVGTDGQFTVENVDLQTSNRYIVTVNYKGRAYGSEAKSGDSGSDTLSLPVTVYETTADASVLTIGAWVSQVQIVGGNLQVTDFIQFTNASDRAYSTDDSIDGIRHVGIQMPVPAGAQVLSVSPSDPRYSVSADGQFVIDSAPVLPGTAYFFQMVYQLPYQGEAAIEQRLPYAFDGAFRLLLGTPTASVESTQLPSIGPQTVGGTQYQGYGAALKFQAGDGLRYVVKGGIEGNTSSAVVVAPDKLVPLLLILVGVILSAAVLVLYFNKNRKLGVQTTNDDADNQQSSLVRQIAELDIAHRDGRIEEETYRVQRDALKSRLTKLLDEQASAKEGTS